VQGEYGNRWAHFYGVSSNRIFKPFKPVRSIFFESSVQTKKNDNVLFVGRLEKQKGTTTLIKSFSDVSQKFPSSELVIVGNGNEVRNLKKLVYELSLANRISLRGTVTGGALASLYRQSAVFVLPSEYELWGRVVGEAAAAGLPIVTTSAVGCVGDLVIDGYNGFVVPPRNPRALADAIITLLKNPELRKKMGERSRKIAEKWSVERAAKAFIDAIEYALQCRGRRNRR